MTVFITNKDLYLLDFMKLSQNILNNPNYSFGDMIFFKRWLDLPNEYTRDELNTTGYKYLDLDYNINNNSIYLRLRNKFLNSMGEAVYLNILNYILSLKGLLFKIDGYADYDLADATAGLYDNNSNNVCSQFNNNNYVCKEIMLCDAPRYLSYLGFHVIEKIDNPADNLFDIKKEIMDNLLDKLNNIFSINNTNIKLNFYTEDDFLYNKNVMLYKDLHRNMRMMPHYRYEVENLSQLYNFIELINNNTTDYVINNLNYPIKTYNIYNKNNEYNQKGGNNERLEHIYNYIKNMSPKTSNKVITPEIYESVIDYNNMLNDHIVDDNYEAKRLEEKATLNSLITKIFHSNFFDNDMLIKFINNLFLIIENKKVFKYIINLFQKTDLTKSVLNKLIIKENTNDLKLDNFIICYIKGSTAIYFNIIDIGSKTINLCKLEETLKNSSLGHSDIDFNLCINPFILEQDKIYNLNLYQNLIDYMSDICLKALQMIGNMFINDIFSKRYFENYISRCNMELTKQYNNDSYDNLIIIDNLLDINYIYPNFELLTILEKDREYVNSELLPLKLVVNKRISEVIHYSDFVLLRLGLPFITNKYLPCLCEIFDISIIKNETECNFIWYHRENLINNNLMKYNNLLNEFYDMNATLLNSINFNITKKIDKRLRRYKFIEKLLSCEHIDKKHGNINSIKYIDVNFKEKIASINSLINNDVRDSLQEYIIKISKKILREIPNLYSFIIDAFTFFNILYASLIKKYEQPELLYETKLKIIYNEFITYLEHIINLNKIKKIKIQEIIDFKYYEHNKNYEMNNINDFITYIWSNSQNIKLSEIREYKYIDTIEKCHEEILQQVVKEDSYTKIIEDKDKNEDIKDEHVKIKPTIVHYSYNDTEEALKHIAVLNTSELFITPINNVINESTRESAMLNVPEKQDIDIFNIPKKQENVVLNVPKKQDIDIFNVPKKQDIDVFNIPEKQENVVLKVPKKQENVVLNVPKKQENVVLNVPKKQESDMINISGKFMKNDVNVLNNNASVEYTIKTPKINMLIIKISVRRPEQKYIKGGRYNPVKKNIYIDMKKNNDNLKADNLKNNDYMMKNLNIFKNNPIKNNFDYKIDIIDNKINNYESQQIINTSLILNLYKKYSSFSNIDNLIKTILNMDFIDYDYIKKESYKINLPRKLNNIEIIKASKILFAPSFCDNYLPNTEFF